MSTAAIILKCFNRKPDDIDLASVDFPGITSERLLQTDADIWALHRTSLLKVEDEIVYLAGIPLGNVCDFPEIADDPVYRAQKDKLVRSESKALENPYDFDSVQEYVDNKENCAFLVLNALEMVHLRAGAEPMSEALRQFKLGYMAVMQKFPEHFYEDLLQYFTEENARLKPLLPQFQYAEILLEQLEFIVENRQYDLSEYLYDQIEPLIPYMNDAAVGKFRYLQATYQLSISSDNAKATYQEACRHLAELKPTWETRLIYSKSLMYLGILSIRDEQYDEASTHLHSALKQLEVIPDDQYVYFMGEKSVIYHQLGYMYEQQEKYDESADYYKIALDIREEMGRYSKKIGGDYGITLGNMAFLYESLGSYSSADQAFRRSIEVRRRLLPLNPREYLGDYARIMYSHLYVIRERDLPEVEDSYIVELSDETIRIFRYLADNSDRSEWRQKLAWLLFDRGIIFYTADEDFTNAESYMKEALAIRESFIDEDEKWIEQASNISYRLGDMFFQQEEYDSAKEYFGKTLQYCRKSSSESRIINVQNRIGECCLLLGEYAQALKFYFSSLSMADALEDPSDKDPKIAYCKSCIGEVYFNMQEYVLSRTFYTQAIQLYTALSQEYPDNATFSDSLTACNPWLDDIDLHLIRLRPKTSYLS